MRRVFDLSLTATLSQLKRRTPWLFDRPRAGPLFNLASNALRFVGRRDRAGRLPSTVKIDISPLCSLACPACLHANPSGRGLDLLDRQSFDKTQRMTVAQFRGIIEQIENRSLSVSLYFYGDPLIHPDFPEMAAIAAEAGLSIHASTHLSYNLSDRKIEELVASGLTHLTIDVDGATQETYGATRVRGKLDTVLRNLERIAEERDRQRSKTPRIEVQHLSFAHHAPDEADKVEALVRGLGADDFSTFPGVYENRSGKLYNPVETDRIAQQEWAPHSPAMLPRCHWPWSGTVIKYNGEVIPCCTWREGQQYAEGGEPRALGNVFEEKLETIWNGAAYRRVRKLAANPAREAGKPEQAKSFCEGCPKVFDSPSPLGDWERG